MTSTDVKITPQKTFAQAVTLTAEQFRSPDPAAIRELARVIDNPDLHSVAIGSAGRQANDIETMGHIIISGDPKLKPRHCLLLRNLSPQGQETIPVHNLSGDENGLHCNTREKHWVPVASFIQCVPDIRPRLRLGSDSSALLIPLDLFSSWCRPAPINLPARADVSAHILGSDPKPNPDVTDTLRLLAATNGAEITIGRSESRMIFGDAARRLAPEQLKVATLSDDRWVVTPSPGQSESAETWASSNQKHWVLLPNGVPNTLDGDTFLNLSGVATFKLPRTQPQSLAGGASAGKDLLSTFWQQRTSKFTVRSDFENKKDAFGGAELVVTGGTNYSWQVSVEPSSAKKHWYSGRSSNSHFVTNESKYQTLALRDESTGKITPLKPGASHHCFTRATLGFFKSKGEFVSLVELPQPK